MTTFQICTCGKHGRLLFHGKAGMEFYSKKVALNLAYTSIMMERINAEDGERIYYEIDGSELDGDGSQVEKEVALKIDKWNQDRYNVNSEGKDESLFQDSENVYKLIHN